MCNNSTIDIDFFIICLSISTLGKEFSNLFFSKTSSAAFKDWIALVFPWSNVVASVARIFLASFSSSPFNFSSFLISLKSISVNNLRNLGTFSYINHNDLSSLKQRAGKEKGIRAKTILELKS